MDLLQSLEIKVGERDELVKGVGGDLSAIVEAITKDGWGKRTSRFCLIRSGFELFGMTDQLPR